MSTLEAQSKIKIITFWVVSYFFDFRNVPILKICGPFLRLEPVPKHELLFQCSICSPYISWLASVLWYMLPPGHQVQSLYSQSQHSGHGQSLVDALERDKYKEKHFFLQCWFPKERINQFGKSSTNWNVISQPEVCLESRAYIKRPQVVRTNQVLPWLKSSPNWCLKKSMETVF